MVAIAAIKAAFRGGLFIGAITLSGTLFGLGLSQRVDPNGTPEAGWKLFLYTANSTTPVTAYKDTGLTSGLEHPWPVQADAYGMMPSFWLADGSYRARGTSNDGSRVFFDLPSVLALGASSGSGGGGSSVDPNAIFSTGRVMWQPISGSISGWVRDNGRTIGSATSGATERANSDCQDLFEFYWNNYSNALCPVIGGRGTSSSSDWTANKQITTLDMRGRSPFGLADMGNSDGGSLTGIPFSLGDRTTPGSLGGEAFHTLVDSEVPPTSLIISSYEPGKIFLDNGNIVQQGDQGDDLSGGGLNHKAIDPSVTIPSFHPTGTVDGGGLHHNNTPLFVLGTFYRKI